MNDKKRKRLEAKGWTFGSADEFLNDYFLNDYSEYEPLDKPTENCGNESLYYLIALGMVVLAGVCLGVAGYWLLF